MANADIIIADEKLLPQAVDLYNAIFRPKREIDFFKRRFTGRYNALTLIARIWGEDQAKLIQLGNEYDPQPPFDAGHPRRAPDVAARYRELTRGMTDARLEAARRAATKLGIAAPS